MLEFIKENIQLITTFAVVLIGVLFVICVIGRFFRVAVGLVVFAVLIPILFTVFWGDGTEYVHQFSSVLTEPHKQNVEAFYEKFKESETPVIDYDAVSDKATHIFEGFKSKAEEAADSWGSPWFPAFAIP